MTDGDRAGGTVLPDLRCRRCGRTYDAGPDEPWRCACGAPLDAAARPLPDGAAPAYGDLDARRGLWALADFLPLPAGQRVSLGEGFTPLVEAPDWDAAFKLEYALPTGSFKDRGATTLLTRAAALGVERVVEDSSGNAGAAIATYAARAGIDATVYVPTGAKSAKLAAIERAGAAVERVAGDRGDVAAACVDAVERGAGWYASHAWNHAFLAGTATIAHEIAAARDWTVPDAVVLPVGHGTLYLGAYRGFRALRDAGWIDRVPRLLAVQASGHAPLAAALGREAGGENPVAEGIHVDAPAREAELLRAIEATDGDALAVDGAAVESELDRLHRRGFYVEPTAAAAPAGLRRYRETGGVGPDEDVVVPLTGSGLKAW